MPVRCNMSRASRLTKDVRARPISTANRYYKTRSGRRWRRSLAIRPSTSRFPQGSGLTAGGLYLGNYVQEGEGADAKIYPIYEDPSCYGADEGH